MYKSLIIIFSAFCLQLNAQLSGEIIYEDKVNIYMDMDEALATRLKSYGVPEYRTSEMVLLFNEAEAVYMAYKNKDATDDVDMRPGGRMRFQGRMASNDILYQNYQKFERIEQRDVMGKLFLLSGEPVQRSWKLTGDTREVGSFTAHKATFSDSTTNIEAWYVPQLQVPLGPAEYGQLPGLVLYVDINEGKRTLTATSIDIRELEENEIIKPEKGKEMEQEEFDEMMRLRMEEMKEKGIRSRFGN